MRGAAFLFFAVAVPAVAAGDVLVARFVGIPLSLQYRVSSLLFKPHGAVITTPVGRYRFIMGTASDLHILRPSPSIGYAAPFAPPTISSFVLTGAGISSGSGGYTVAFYSLPVASP